MKVEKERQNLKEELNKIQIKIKISSTNINDYNTQISNLMHILEEAETEQIRQRKELEIILSEQTTVGVQVIFKLLFPLFY